MGFISQRSHPVLAQLDVEILDTDAKELLLQHPRIGRQSATAFAGGESALVTIWKDSVAATCIPSASLWASELFQEPIRLVWLDNLQARTYAGREGPAFVGFADAQPILAIHQADLNHLSVTVNQQLTAARFRPNIVLAGGDAPTADQWTDLQIGEQKLLKLKPCERCRVITLDPSTGESDMPTLLKTLMQSHAVAGKPAFGTTYQAENFAPIRQGAAVVAFLS